jgi:hypothetical protein
MRPRIGSPVSAPRQRTVVCPADLLQETAQWCTVTHRPRVCSDGRRMRHQWLTPTGTMNAGELRLSWRRSIDGVPIVLLIREVFRSISERLDRRRVVRAAKQNGNRSEVRARMRAVMAAQNR